MYNQILSAIDNALLRLRKIRSQMGPADPHASQLDAQIKALESSRRTIAQQQTQDALNDLEDNNVLAHLGNLTNQLNQTTQQLNNLSNLMNDVATAVSIASDIVTTILPLLAA